MAEQEVNREIEVIGDEPASTTPEAGEGEPAGGEDEVLVPAVDEEELKRALASGSSSGSPGTASTPSSPADSSAATSAQPESSSQPKPVEETPREKALRLEVQRLKTDMRDADKQRIAGMSRPPAQAIADERIEKLKKIYSEEEIANMEEAIDIIATKRGYVKKEETYHEVINSVLDNFIETHPEYKPINDTDDVRWNRFQEVLIADYNLQGKTPKQLAQIYAKVHRDVNEELGEPVSTNTTNRINAQQQKIKSVSHAGGTQSAASPSKKLSIDPSVRKMFKGFDDEDLI